VDSKIRVFSKMPNCREVKFRTPSFAVAVALAERSRPSHGSVWMNSLRWVLRSFDSRLARLFDDYVFVKMLLHSQCSSLTKYTNRMLSRCEASLILYESATTFDLRLVEHPPYLCGRIARGL
jgi:hypothetical protein